MASLRKAIDAKCKECIHDPLSGNGSWRQQTGKYPVRSCPLWEVRPRSSAAEEVAKTGTSQHSDATREG